MKTKDTREFKKIQICKSTVKTNQKGTKNAAVGFELVSFPCKNGSSLEPFLHGKDTSSNPKIIRTVWSIL